MDSLLPKVTQRSPCGYFALPVYLGCLCRSGKVSVVTLKHICELSWVCLAWSLEISLYPLQTGHCLLLMPNFLPNRFKLFRKVSLPPQFLHLQNQDDNRTFLQNSNLFYYFLNRFYLNMFHDIICVVSIRIRKEEVYSELNVVCKKRVLANFKFVCTLQLL